MTGPDDIITIRKNGAGELRDTGKNKETRTDKKHSVRELRSDEFPAADTFWVEYHETTGDPATDRIFAVFSGELLVSLARCRRHPDGMDVDGIFTPEEHRLKGYSRLAVGALVEACHNDDLYMHAVRHLIGFYTKQGFIPIAEKDLPPTIRERYVWAGGNLEGAEVQPMYRKAGLFAD
ncbi:MAG: GNAT family N-acetyltransferase [Methanomicrobiales archaeon]